MTFFVVEDLSIRFGGIRAIAQLSLTLEQGGIYGLIGPNGAGKTSLINAITGPVAIADGRIILDGSELQDLPAHRIAAAGVGRTFQHAEPLADQTVLENLRTGGYAHRGSALLQDLLGTPAKRAAERQPTGEARAMLGRFGIENLGAALTADLPFGTLKKVDIARALMARPRLLMLDEPVSGMNMSEAQEAITTCRRIAQELGVTLLVVEHNMRVIMELAETIFVLDHGEKIAEGTPHEIQRDPLVTEAYLGASGPADA